MYLRVTIDSLSGYLPSTNLLSTLIYLFIYLKLPLQNTFWTSQYPAMTSSTFYLLLGEDFFSTEQLLPYIYILMSLLQTIPKLLLCWSLANFSSVCLNALGTDCIYPGSFNDTWYFSGTWHFSKLGGTSSMYCENSGNNNCFLKAWSQTNEAWLATDLYPRSVMLSHLNNLASSISSTMSKRLWAL